MQVSKIQLSRLAIAASLMAMAGAAAAQTITSGGASLPAPMYQAIMTGSNVLGTWTYNSKSSGVGKAAFLSNDATGLNGIAGPVQIVGSDSALSTGEFTTYQGTQQASMGRLIQVPAVLTPVLLAYKETGVSGLDLSTEQVCKILSFDPSYRTWTNLGGTGNALSVKYRNETSGSGTTELLAKFLVAACGPYLPAGKAFTQSNVFKNVVATALPDAGTFGPVNADGLPAAWEGVAGSLGMSGAVANVHAIGYMSPDSVYTGNDNSIVAKINSKLPEATSIQGALPAPPATAAQRAIPTNWVPAYSVPATAYPIYGTTNLLLGQCYIGGATAAGAKGTAVKDFLTKLNNGTYNSFITGHNFVPLPTAWNTAIREAFLTSTNGLSIGHSSCGSLGRT